MQVYSASGGIVPTTWEDEEDPATFRLIKRVHDMTDEEFCRFCRGVKRARDNSHELYRGVSIAEAYSLAVADAEYRHKLRGVNFPI